MKTTIKDVLRWKGERFQASAQTKIYGQPGKMKVGDVEVPTIKEKKNL